MWRKSVVRLCLFQKNPGFITPYSLHIFFLADTRRQMARTKKKQRLDNDDQLTNAQLDVIRSNTEKLRLAESTSTQYANYIVRYIKYSESQVPPVNQTLQPVSEDDNDVLVSHILRFLISFADGKNLLGVINV